MSCKYMADNFLILVSNSALCLYVVATDYKVKFTKLPVYYTSCHIVLHYYLGSRHSITYCFKKRS